MSFGWLCFLFGLFLGSGVGFMVAALCAIAGRDSDENGMHPPAA